MSPVLHIASRKRRLALWQSDHVQQLLQERLPSHTIEIKGYSTKGDEILDRSLSAIGGKGLFIK